MIRHIPGRPYSKRYANKNDMSDKGQTINTIHQGET